jgi:hypothetical protein
MDVYKNTLNGNLHIAENHLRAWLHFSNEARRKGEERPTMDDVIKIEKDNRIDQFKSKGR